MSFSLFVNFNGNCKEAVEFYYSPHIVSGMEKDHVLHIISKYYPQLFTKV